MTGLGPRADQVVRDAVDAFMEDRRIVVHDGDAVLETKNSRYSLVDGVVFSAPDPSMHGAEFVGWLCDTERRTAVEQTYDAGLRAIFVDRARGRHIIVTSTIIRVTGAPLRSIERDPEPSYPLTLERRRTPVPEQAPIPLVAATPSPPPAAPAPPEARMRITNATRPPPPPPRRAGIPAPLPSPIPSPRAPQVAPQNASPWSDARAAVSPARAAMPLIARPLPVPVPPPRRAITPVPPAPEVKIAEPWIARDPPLVMDPPPPDSLPELEAPEPLPSATAWPRVELAPQAPEEPSLLASSDVLDAVDPPDTDRDFDDVEETEPTSPPFLLARPATQPPPAPASQPGNEPFLLGRPAQRNAPLR